MQDWPEREHYTAEDLIQIIRILRDPEAGCPWDKVQTHQSIRKNFLEETCEALEAIDADDAAMLREELGDVLMQVAFHTLPALMRAQKLQKRAAGRGLGVTTAEDAAAALKQAEQDWDAAPTPNAEQAGELLFAAVNAIRLAGLDAEEALTFASKRFRDELLADQT